MNFYFSAPVWNEQHQAPNTIKHARAVQPKSGRGAKVIVITEAKYRGATLSGTFVLGDKNELPLPRKDWHTVEIYCCWFGLRLKTRGLHFKVNMSSAEVIDDYAGLVASNITS